LSAAIPGITPFSTEKSTPVQNICDARHCIPDFEGLRLPASTAEKVSENKTLLIRSRLGDPLGEATRRATKPEKTDRLCEEQLGFGTAKAVIASEGCDGTRIHAANSFARVGS
jgi:hypothetical protein